MRLVCISDTHGRHGEVSVPDGDVLVVAGDICGAGYAYEVGYFHEWIANLPHTHKVLVAGNHDWPFQRTPDAPEILALKKDVTYLQDSGCIIDGVSFYGSPWQPEFYNWAFNLPRGTQLAEKWAKIPFDTDVLITHTPPFGYLDAVFTGMRVGCEDLASAVAKVRPRVHVFGHIHHSYGVIGQSSGTFYVNACICTEAYGPENSPIVVDI